MYFLNTIFPKIWRRKNTKKINTLSKYFSTNFQHVSKSLASAHLQSIL